MRQLQLKQQMTPKPWQLIIDEFKGTATVLDDAITGKEYAKEALNLMQKQDGRWTGRWGRVLWGTAVSGETSLISGDTYTKADGTQELIVIGGTTGKAFKSVNGGTWTEITGATFDTTAKNVHFKQINNYLFISNGVDRLTRYNGTVLSRYSSISTPTGGSGTRGAGLSAGSFNNYYQITALNDIGETAGSTEILVTTNKTRDVWNGASNEYIDISWSTVAGATKYQIYYSDISGKEELLAEATGLTYRDSNTDTVNPFAAVPTQDSTGAPKFSMIATSGSRIWGIAPLEYKWRVFFSGTGQYLGYFGYTFGGGWVDLDFGSDEQVSFIEHYRTGKGDTSATVFTKNPRGGGSVWQVNLTTTTVGTDTVVVPVPEKIVGSAGANSQGAALLVGDVIMYLSAYGVQTLSNKANITNVLSTTEESRDIQPSYLGLNFAKADQFRAYRYKNLLFFSATEGGGENDLIFIRDIDLNRWYYKWDFGVKKFIEYVSNGVTKFLVIPTSGNQFVELSENIKTDFGVAIRTSLLSGLIPVDRDKYIFVKVLEALIDLGRPKGTVNFEVLGVEKKKGFASLAVKPIVLSSASSGAEFWSGDLGEILLLNDEDAPKTYNQASVRKRKRIGKSIHSIQFHVYSDSLDTEYTILSMQATGIIDPTRPPSSYN